MFKIINMLNVNLLDIFFVSNYAIIMSYATICFFKFNTISLHVKKMSTEKKNVKSKSSKKGHNIIYIKSIILSFFFLLIQNNLYRGFPETLWNDHIFITNFSIFITNCILAFAILTFYLIYNLSFSKLYFSVDFLYSVMILFFVINFLFISNTFITFYFILELSVCLTFFKFTVSRF